MSNINLNISDLQSFVADVAEAMLECITSTESKSLVPAEMVEALKDRHRLNLTEVEIEAVFTLTNSVFTRVNGDPKAKPPFSRVRRRGYGLGDWQPGATGPREPGARVQKWVTNTRDQMLHGLILAGFGRDQLVASKIASEREIDIALANLADAREKERTQREAIEAFVAAHKPAKTG